MRYTVSFTTARNGRQEVLFRFRDAALLYYQGLLANAGVSRVKIAEVTG